ncbi:MAG: hypothetical protein KY476_04350 [Planctomycetes bacterium]|nr:hypothetical protein [Planctomycetota bacterium]
MPLHDWTPVPAGLFHHFHQDWSIEIARTLNRGVLPAGLSALVEQRSGPLESDVLAIEGRGGWAQDRSQNGGTATLAKPTTAVVRRSTKQLYASRANRIVVRHHLGRMVAVIEIVSPGNKESRAAFRDFLDKTVGFLQAGLQVLVVDLFPPTRRDPQGIHKAIWDEVADVEDFPLSDDRNRMLASYENQPDGELIAYLEPMGVGEELPDIPLFIAGGVHVPVPLEATYQTTWNATPEALRRAVETGIMPDTDGG